MWRAVPGSEAPWWPMADSSQQSLTAENARALNNKQQQRHKTLNSETRAREELHPPRTLLARSKTKPTGPEWLILAPPGLYASQLRCAMGEEGGQPSPGDHGGRAIRPPKAVAMPRQLHPRLPTWALRRAMESLEGRW